MLKLRAYGGINNGPSLVRWEKLVAYQLHTFCKDAYVMRMPTVTWCSMVAPWGGTDGGLQVTHMEPAQTFLQDKRERNVRG